MAPPVHDDLLVSKFIRDNTNKLCKRHVSTLQQTPYEKLAFWKPILSSYPTAQHVLMRSHCACSQAKNMASVPRKRAWGRSKHRDDITVADEKGIELAEKESREVKRTRRDTDSDLQYPEGMTNDELVAILKKMRVPLPVSTGENPSRESLLRLFRRHVTPRPQRTRRPRRSQRPPETGATPTEPEPVMEWSKSVGDLAQESSENDRKRQVGAARFFLISSTGLYPVGVYSNFASGGFQI